MSKSDPYPLGAIRTRTELEKILAQARERPLWLYEVYSHGTEGGKIWLDASSRMEERSIVGSYNPNSRRINSSELINRNIDEFGKSVYGKKGFFFTNYWLYYAYVLKLGATLRNMEDE